MSAFDDLKSMTDEDLYKELEKKFGVTLLSELDEKDVNDPVVVELASRLSCGRN